MIPAISILTLIMILSSSDVNGEWDTFHGDPSRTGYRDSDFIAGDLLWEEDLGNGYLDTSPVTDGDRVFLISAGEAGLDSTVHCLDAGTGDFIWNTTVPGKTYQLSTPVAAKGRLYFGSSSGMFSCLVAETGSIRWERPLALSANGVTSSPAFDEPSGELYVGNGDGTLYCLEIGTGNTIWSYDTGAQIYFSSPSVFGDLIVIGNDDGILFGIRDGNEEWRYETGDRIRSSACISDDGMIYFASEDGLLRSLTIEGELNWEAEIGRSTSTPALGTTCMYVGSDSGLHAFRFDGTREFTIPSQAPVDSSPALNDHQIFFTTNSVNGEIITSDLEGNLLWSYPLEEHGLSSPGLGDSTVLAAADNGRVWCFHSTAPRSLNLTVEPQADLVEGEHTIAFQGIVRYDTGRPAVDIDIGITLLGRTTSGRTGTNGSFSINLTIDLVPGNHSGMVTANDGTLTDERTITIKVREGSSGGSDSGDTDEFISGFGSSTFLLCAGITVVSGFIRRRRRRRRTT